jgi:hypothetical protein
MEKGVKDTLLVSEIRKIEDIERLAHKWNRR